MPRDVAETYYYDLLGWIDRQKIYINERYEDKEVFNCEFYFKQLCKVVYCVLGEEEVCD